MLVYDAFRNAASCLNRSALSNEKLEGPAKERCNSRLVYYRSIATDAYMQQGSMLSSVKLRTTGTGPFNQRIGEILVIWTG
jgi:hypothetical protein